MNVRYRTIDLVTIATLAVAFGVVFWGWGKVYSIPGDALYAAYPAAVSLLAAPWLMAGIVGGLIIRKPGAALATEMLAALAEMLVPGGTQWGTGVLLSGLFQGLGAELVVAVLLYKRFGPVVAAGMGALSGLFESIYELSAYYEGAFTGIQPAVFVACFMLSGAVVAGLGSWLLVRALARAGVLDAFGAGRESVPLATSRT